MLINGKCHCGNFSFRLEWPGERPEIPARACACSFCAVANVNTFENVDAALLRRANADFEVEATASRLARRMRNWIADVRFD